MAVQLDAITQNRLRSDNTVRTDFYILANLGAVFDNGGWMHF
jgi:hypothetical protein